MHHPIQVLFVCDGGASRAVMAEALLHKLDAERFEAHSAGLEPQAPEAAAMAVMRESGIELPTAPGHHINDFEDKQFDYVITLCDEARESCLAFPRDGHNLHWSCPDPAQAQGGESERLNAYREAREHLRQQIEDWADNLRE